jgi:asparagine synthase (glutamine-hydrolysing)
MCGIAGMVAVDGLDRDAPSRALRMRDVLTHRGPDEAGLHCDTHAALAHRRLSIVDLSSGQQPLSNEDGGIWTIFNGEIYNHADVRKELEAFGHVYRTRSDTETIVHAYEQWGDECVQRFRGMFAFAIWDASKRRLLLVRDRLGIKPLYWTRTPGALLFGSEIKAILASGLIQPRTNDAVLPEVLSMRYTSGEGTMFHGIHKLLPGHLLVFEGGTITKRRYWDVPARETKGPAVNPVRRFRELLEESVRLPSGLHQDLAIIVHPGAVAIAAQEASGELLLVRQYRHAVGEFKHRAFNELATRARSRRPSAPSRTTLSSTRAIFSARCRN